MIINRAEMILLIMRNFYSDREKPSCKAPATGWKASVAESDAKGDRPAN